MLLSRNFRKWSRAEHCSAVPCHEKNLEILSDGCSTQYTEGKVTSACKEAVNYEDHRGTGSCNVTEVKHLSLISLNVVIARIEVFSTAICDTMARLLSTK